MPFTEEQVTEVATKLGESPEVVKKFLAQDEKSPEVIAFLGKLKTSTILGETDFNTRIENERKMAAEEAQKLATGNTYGAIDKRIKEKTAIEKKENEKTADYLDRVIAEKIKANGGDTNAEIERLKADLSAKESLLATKDTEFEKMKVEYATKEKTLAINAKLDSAINALPIDVEEKYLASHRKLLKMELEDKYKIELVEGVVQFTEKATNKVVRNPTTANVATEAEVITLFAPQVVSLKNAASGKRGSGFKETPLDLSKLDNAQFAHYPTLKDFTDHLKTSGISLVSEEAREKMEQYQAWKAKQ